MSLKRLKEAFVHLLRSSERGGQWQQSMTSRFREAAGGASGLFFPHRVYYLPKVGPNALHLASRMCGTPQPDRFWQVILRAYGPALEVRSQRLSSDRDLLLHEQRHGTTGHVAVASFIQEVDRLYGLNYVSDSCPGASSLNEHKEGLESGFQGWPELLLNAILHFAAERKILQIYSPKSGLVRVHAALTEAPCSQELLERIYDRAVTRNFLFTQTPDWWILDVPRNAGQLIPLTSKQESLRPEKTICLFHDIERGLGQTGANAGFGLEVDRQATRYLRRMLAIEREAGVKVTYNVVGSILGEVREEIERDGHAIAFHSYDHDLTKGQLERCRCSDDRIRGYRAPMSILTGELSDGSLTRHGFDWLAIAASKAGAAVPTFRGGVVWIPVLLDDYALHSRRMDYESWEQVLLSKAAGAHFVAVGLHDCYAGYWLDRYEELLGKLKALCRFSTMDEVASTMILASAT